MKNYISMFVLASLSTASIAFADTQSAGFAQCITMATDVALNDYAITHPLSQLPEITIGKTGQSPSTGLDLKIVVNNTVAYYVIASPIGGGPKAPFIGCSQARIFKRIQNN